MAIEPSRETSTNGVLATSDLTNNWQKFDFGGLTFRVPPGMTNVSVRGGDSLFGRWDSTNIVLTLDFGRFANVTFGSGASDLVVSGRSAKMNVDLTGLYTRGQSRTNIAEVGVPKGPKGEFLRMTFYFKEASDLPSIRAIINSVRF